MGVIFNGALKCAENYFLLQVDWFEMSKVKDDDKGDNVKKARGGTKRKTYDICHDTSTLPVRMALLLESLKRFYKNGAFETTVLPILKDREPLPLRDLDWLVTNYSLAHPVVYPNPKNPMGKPFNVYDSYQLHQNQWRKKLFDPFQRGQRITFEVNGEQVVTTIAQLNFFKWAIEYGVIEWAAKHRNAISQHHQTVLAERAAALASNGGKKQKRMRLTHVPENSCLVYIAPMRLKW